VDGFVARRTSSGTPCKEVAQRLGLPIDDEEWDALTAYELLERRGEEG
jgi:hypothetical protein